MVGARLVLLARVGLLLCAGLGACYALPERHPLARQAERDAGEDPVSTGDGDGAVDAQPDASGGTLDASHGEDARSNCRCGDAQRPVCIETTGLCVACTSSDRGACTTDQLCNVVSGECVECLQHTDCKDAKASVCDAASHSCMPCVDDGDCAHVEGKQVCLAGECVQCTQDKKSACTTSEGNPAACDPAGHACTQREVRHTQGCGTCVSDDECFEGYFCVLVPAGAGSKVCQPAASENHACPRPYVNETSRALISAEGKEQKICTLGVASTSCAAHLQYRTQRCGTPDPQDAERDLPDSGVDTRCGVEDMDDGRCVFWAGFKQFRCTVPCTPPQPDDCPLTATSCDVVSGSSSGGFCYQQTL